MVISDTVISIFLKEKFDLIAEIFSEDKVLDATIVDDFTAQANK